MAKRKRFQLSFTMENAAFDDAPGVEIARILGAVAKDAAEFGPDEFHLRTIYDVNGNAIGRWESDARD